MFGLRKGLGKMIALCVASVMLLMFFPSACCLASSFQTWYDDYEGNLIDVYSASIFLDDSEPPTLLVVGLETYEGFYDSWFGLEGCIIFNMDTDSNPLTGCQIEGLGIDYSVFISNYEGELIGTLFVKYGEADFEIIDKIGIYHDFGSNIMDIYFPWDYIGSPNSFRWNLNVFSKDIYDYGYWDWVPDMTYPGVNYEIWEYEALPDDTPTTPETSTTATFVIGQSAYTLEGVTKSMDAAPYIKNGRTYVPVRYLAYALGIDEGGIAWNSETQTVTLIKDGTTVNLVIGSKARNINGVSSWMDVAPEIWEGRTMLPARWVAEAFGATVGWDSTNRTVTITY